jgi:peptidyl-prolyl cis-trans isomerase-like protein 2
MSKVLDKIKDQESTLAIEHKNLFKQAGPTNQNINQEEEQDGRKAHFSTGVASASFTSSVMDIYTKNEAITYNALETMFIDMRAILSSKNKNKDAQSKSYIQITTNHGEMNFELYSAHCPITCYNFIELAKKGYYDNTKFHRNIAGFMIQGGDPTASGKGGESIYDEPFQDEFHKDLKHGCRGMLSMANSGHSTNTSQLYNVYYSWLLMV